jgi:hypothetical protein
MQGVHHRISVHGDVAEHKDKQHHHKRKSKAKGFYPFVQFAEKGFFLFHFLFRVMRGHHIVIHNISSALKNKKSGVLLRRRIFYLGIGRAGRNEKPALRRQAKDAMPCFRLIADKSFG